jgi:DNA-binding transcriptional ArsR family regulator
VKLFERRRQQAQLIVIGALLGQGELTTTQLTQRTGLTIGRLHVALAALEGAGRVTSRWQNGPYPRRRLYRYAFAKGGIIRAAGGGA